ncbi:MAG: hypothetical protein RRY29_06220 [Desulfovibrionaceae bacterium]
MKLFILSIALCFGLTTVMSLPVSIPVTQGTSLSFTADAHAKTTKKVGTKSTKKKSGAAKKHKRSK